MQRSEPKTTSFIVRIRISVDAYFYVMYFLYTMIRNKFLYEKDTREDPTVL